MNVKPIENYKTPTYPNKNEALKNPDLLKTLPERWKGKACTVVALSSLLFMILTSCSTKENPESTGSDTGKVSWKKR